jgi:pSer/pThr/pTyr-binding forkhead associated (FHA) protein
MPPRLISLDGQADIPLDRLLVIVGRHRSCDARIDSLRVSRRHCCLGLDSEGVLVRDLGSANGTWINGVRIDDGLLRPGDELAIAHLRFHVDLGARGGVSECAGPAASIDGGGGSGDTEVLDPGPLRTSRREAAR